MIFVDLICRHFDILMSQYGQMNKSHAFQGCSKIVFWLHTARTGNSDTPRQIWTPKISTISTHQITPRHQVGLKPSGIKCRVYSHCKTCIAEMQFLLIARNPLPAIWKPQFFSDKEILEWARPSPFGKKCSVFMIKPFWNRWDPPPCQKISASSDKEIWKLI